MKRLPEASTVTPKGEHNDAEVAGPPSPEKPQLPLLLLPAEVVMLPLADTFRIRLLYLSAMKIFPEASTATPEGLFNDAEVAGPPSPDKPAVPLPATVVMIPLAETFRIRLLPESAMKRFPEASTATSAGPNDAEVASPPSPRPELP